MRNLPNKIYLQVGLEKEGSVEDFAKLSTDFVTWESKKIFSDDLEFISVNSILSRIKELEKDVYIDSEHKRQRIKELKNLIK